MFLPMDVLLSRYDVVEPDLLYFSRELEQTLERSDRVKGAPNLVMEVASPSTRRRDQTLKRQLHEQFGVDEYWLVDPDAETILVLRLQDGVYREAALLRRDNGDVLTTPRLPAFELTLGDVFAR